MLQAALVLPTAKLDLSHILQSSPSPPPSRKEPPSFSRSISVPNSSSRYPVSSPTASTTSHYSNATAPASSYSQREIRATGPSNNLAPLGSSNAPSSKRPSPLTPHPQASPAKKQSKWTPNENALIISLRGSGMKWEDISKRLPGRSAISCRLHYQNYLERRSEWDEEKKNKLARLYDRMKSEMWANVARDLGVPWRTAEAMHWHLGEEEMAKRAGGTRFTMAAASGPSDPSSAGASLGTSSGSGARGGIDGNSSRGSDNEARAGGRRSRKGDRGSQGNVLPSLAELEGGVGVYETYEDEDEEEE